ncbi:MAG: PASTA domain-containing protein [Candidatus Paceibacterota bacterium]
MKHLILFLVCVSLFFGCPPVEPGGDLSLSVSLPNGNSFAQGETFVATVTYAGSRAPYSFKVEFDDGVSATGTINTENKLSYSVVPSSGSVSLYLDSPGYIEVNRPVWTTTKPSGQSSVVMTLSGADGQEKSKAVSVQVPVLSALALEVTANGGAFAVEDHLVFTVTAFGGQPPYLLEAVFPPVEVFDSGFTEIRAETVINANGDISWPSGFEDYNVVPSLALGRNVARIISFKSGHVSFRYKWFELVSELGSIRVSVTDDLGQVVTDSFQAGVVLEESIPVIVPSLIGWDEQEAISEIFSLGFWPSSPKVYDTSPLGQVFRQDLDPGEEINIGSVFTIRVSAGPNPNP